MDVLFQNESYSVEDTNVSASNGSVTDQGVPVYLRDSMTVILSLILVVGVTGNVLVPFVIVRSKDLRNSTNVFLVNLALADLLVIIFCLPTGFMELFLTPEAWYLGETMCLLVTFVELIAPHASVLTILAISFERYYAICQPLKAGYICTKSRAMAISIFTWLSAGILTSPILALTEYSAENSSGPDQHFPTCGANSDSYWTKLYFQTSFSLFFLIPCVILMILYALIARHLMLEPPRITHTNSTRQPRRHHRRLNANPRATSNRARRQVVAMLGAVVISFFVCLLPYRVITLVSSDHMQLLEQETFYNLLYFCRVMVYLNSAVNPILYNLMSSKFRSGFLRLFGLGAVSRQGTMSSSSATTGTTSSSNTSSTALLRNTHLKTSQQRAAEI